MNNYMNSVYTRTLKYFSFAFAIGIGRFFNLNQQILPERCFYMTTKLSRMYGMDIFSDGGKFLGNAQDFIVDIEGGSIARVLTEQLPATKDDAKKSLRDKSILYSNVKSVDDVIVITKSGNVGLSRE